MLFGLDKSAGGLKLLSFKGLLTALAYPCTVAEQRTCVDAALDVLNVDSHDSYETFVVTTWIWYAKDLRPLYVVSLLSGLCFKVWTSS